MKQTSDAVDLEAYFQRIGYRDAVRPFPQGHCLPTLETLQAIHQLHPETIAFENLNSLLKQPVHLDLPSLQEKLIAQGRGGYCFEQNLLLRSVLVALGFQVKNLAARVMLNAPKGKITPRSHMLLLVEIESQSYIADVGFGGLTLTAPLRLLPDLEQPTPHETFRLVTADDCANTYILQVKLGQVWKPVYRFDLQEQQLPDYEVSNWYISTYPESQFVNNLIVARPGSACRYTLRNNQFSIYKLNGQTEKRVLKTVSELRTVLEDVFRLELPAIDSLDDTLQRIVIGN